MKNSELEIIYREGQAFFVQRRRNGTIKNIEKVINYEVSGSFNYNAEEIDELEGFLITAKRQKMTKTKDMPFKTIIRRIKN